jgi:hypothetical protein
MRKVPHRQQETLQLDLEASTFKELLRDLLFREAGKPYFKRFATPRRYRWFGAWRTLSTYQAERQLLPVGGRNTDQLIRQTLTTHGCLRVEFQETGMPVTAIRVLQERCLPLNAAIEQIQVLECVLKSIDLYQVFLIGGSLPPPAAAPIDKKSSLDSHLA